jgi:hypothetical protein
MQKKKIETSFLYRLKIFHREITIRISYHKLGIEFYSIPVVALLLTCNEIFSWQNQYLGRYLSGISFYIFEENFFVSTLLPTEY